MDRRAFFKTTVSAAAAFAITPLLKRYENLYAQTVMPKYDLTAVIGGQPDKMLDSALSSIGGIGTIVKKGSRVVIKPNAAWDVEPIKAANTNPLIVTGLIAHCLAAGAKEVLVFDNTCDNWKKSYKNSGIEKAVKDAGGKMVPANSEKYYQKVDLPSAVKLKNAKVHELMLDCDVFINVPVLKHHSSTKMTSAMKNLMGAVWDRGFWHVNDLHQCIADFPFLRKPDLNIIDAYRVMMNHGPRGSSGSIVENKKALILSSDIVAADSAAAKIFGLDPSSVQYIKTADSLKLGKMDLTSLKINRITL